MPANGSDISITDGMPALGSVNLTSQDYLDIPKTTEIWVLITGYNTKPAPIPQDLPTGYLSWSDAQNNQYNFFYAPGAGTNIIYYAEQNKQPFTVGEILTLGGMPVTSHFTGAVQVVTGRQDRPYCAGDGPATGDPAMANIPAGVGMYLPESSNFNACIPEDTGHGINLHYSAVMAYRDSGLPEGEYYYPFVDLRNNGWQKGEPYRYGIDLESVHNDVIHNFTGEDRDIPKFIHYLKHHFLFCFLPSTPSLFRHISPATNQPLPELNPTKNKTFWGIFPKKE
ncbi:hypothetical protein GJ744_005474 [Endocarpon pusillum]|uniref:Uncharacterized protein n=1 Tax=Endocarpon pusillum TaxID=364733 RepID=A0A8H7A5M0_9EURO|nr:hypothetical protein GJ744_005474 [Endocarpon pusillum]